MVVVYTRRTWSSMSTAAAMVAVAVAVAVLTLSSINGCGAAVLLKTNVTYDRYCVNGGAADENCLIAEDLELEFLMDSHISRFLADAPTIKSEGAGNRNAAAKPCGNGKPGQQYCQDGGQKIKEHAGKYQRRKTKP